jgi:hypothetical protein
MSTARHRLQTDQDFAGRADLYQQFVASTIRHRNTRRSSAAHDVGIPVPHDAKRGLSAASPGREFCPLPVEACKRRRAAATKAATKADGGWVSGRACGRLSSAAGDAGGAAGCGAAW